MQKNRKLSVARGRRKDEFYTQLDTIEKELIQYKDHFLNKVCYSNCDPKEESNFCKYFESNFTQLGLKKYIATCYNDKQLDFFPCDYRTRPAYSQFHTYEREIPTWRCGVMKGNGDFRSAECIDILKNADVVVTNPPFSLFRQYMAQLIKYKKKFLNPWQHECRKIQRNIPSHSER